jgi:beta-phosphoglucomutase-like phosphatase (HAD superfamily)
VIEAVIFDIDGTLVDSVDLHARAWQWAFRRFGRDVPFTDIRSQIGKGADQLLPVFFSLGQHCTLCGWSPGHAYSRLPRNPASQQEQRAIPKASSPEHAKQNAGAGDLRLKLSPHSANPTRCHWLSQYARSMRE